MINNFVDKNFKFDSPTSTLPSTKIKKNFLILMGAKKKKKKCKKKKCSAWKGGKCICHGQ